MMQVDLYLCHVFEWTFYVANMSEAIIVADFLRHFNLLVVIKGQKLVNSLTIIANAQPAPGSSSQLVVIHKDHQFAALLKFFPSLTWPYTVSVLVKHHITHHIETTGPSVHPTAHHLAPECYWHAKAEFESLLCQGIVWPNSTY